MPIFISRKIRHGKVSLMYIFISLKNRQAKASLTYIFISVKKSSSQSLLDLYIYFTEKLVTPKPPRCIYFPQHSSGQSILDAHIYFTQNLSSQSLLDVYIISLKKSSCQSLLDIKGRIFLKASYFHLISHKVERNLWSSLSSEKCECIFVFCYANQTIKRSAMFVAPRWI